MAAVIGKDGNGSGLNPQPSFAVWGDSFEGFGVAGTSAAYGGVLGQSTQQTGVTGLSDSGNGVTGISNGGTYGVMGIGKIAGVYGQGRGGVGVFGESEDDAGVHGQNPVGNGIEGVSRSGNGVAGYATPGGVAGYFENKLSRGTRAPIQYGVAGVFQGHVQINGNLMKHGGGFKIDHPLDPNRKHLCHSFVESSDMKNIYDGVVRLNAKGEAVVRLPAWFGALNKDFRYQLTPIGASASNLHIAQEIRQNKFTISGGKPKMKVSWQVTGIRRDPWAVSHRIRIEEDKVGKQATAIPKA